MILSISRRTDIPAFYPEWLMNRFREGFALVRNPMNHHGVSRISLSPDVVDCIVFWTKNPAPLLPFLDQIDQTYPFYFQFTLNAYGTDLEPNLPALSERLRTFRQLSRTIGKERVIWRYDPVMLTERYSVAWHMRTFASLADQLAGHANSCIFSLVDPYAKVKKNLEIHRVAPITPAEIDRLARAFSTSAHAHGMVLKTCAEAVDLDAYGIEHACCIYCYANHSQPRVQKSVAAHISTSPLLIGTCGPSDKITDRKAHSLRGDRAP